MGNSELSLGLAIWISLCGTAIVTIAVVVAIESVIIKLMAGTKVLRAVIDSVTANLTSAGLILFSTGCVVFTLGPDPLINLRLASLYWNLFFGALLALFALSTMVEAGILALRKTVAPKEALRVSAVANLVSNLIVVPGLLAITWRW